MGFPVNEEKQAFIRHRLALDPMPRGKEGKAARQYYAGLYHRTDAGVRRRDAEARWAEERGEGKVDDESGGEGMKAVMGEDGGVAGDAGKAETRESSATTKTKTRVATGNQTPDYDHRIEGSTSPEQDNGQRESSTTTTATDEKAEDGLEAVSPVGSQVGNAERKASSSASRKTSSMAPRKASSTSSRKASSMASRKASSTASRKASSTASRKASSTVSSKSSSSQAPADEQVEAASAETEDSGGNGGDALAAAMDEEVFKSATTEQQDEASMGGESQHNLHEIEEDAVEDLPPATVTSDSAPETLGPVSATRDSTAPDETPQVEVPSNEDQVPHSPRTKQDAGTSAPTVDVGAQIGPITSLPGLGLFNNGDRGDNDAREAVPSANTGNDEAAEAMIERSTAAVRDEDRAEEDTIQHERVNAPAAPAVVAPETIVPEAATVANQPEEDASLANEENAVNDAGSANEASSQDDTTPAADEQDAYSDVYSPSVSSNDIVPSVSSSPPPTQTAPPPQDTSSYAGRKRSRESEHDPDEFDRENDAIDRWARAMDGNAVGSGMAATRYGTDEIGVDDEDEDEEDEQCDTQAPAEESSFDEMVRQALDGDDGDPAALLYVAPDTERGEEREAEAPVRPHKKPRLRRPSTKGSVGSAQRNGGEESAGGEEIGGQASSDKREGDEPKVGDKERGAPTYDYGTTLDALLRELS